MKKTVTANVSGTVFHIEEDAYERLQGYLEGIKARLEGTAGRQEIMADIEARIAELFQERMAGQRQVVSIEDVDHVIAVMGQPEDYGDGQAEQATAGQTAQEAGGKGYKRLYRDPDDKWVGGVIGGLAAYIGMDPLWLRIIMIVFILLGSGTPILLYILLWILVPLADTPADRLRMEGEPVTVDNLKRAFEEGGRRVAHEANEIGKRWSSGASRRSSAAGQVIVKLLGAGIVLFAFSLLLGLVTTAIGGTWGLWHATWSSDDMGLLDFAGLLFNSHEQTIWLMVGLALLCLIPVVGLLLAGFKLLLDTETPRWLGVSLTALWIAAFVPVTLVGIELGREFHRSNSVRESIDLAPPAGDILYLDALMPAETAGDWSFRFKEGELDVDLDGLHVADGMIAGGWGRLDVAASPDSVYRLVVVREAHGRNAKAALARASAIAVDHRQEGEVLQVSPVIRFPAADKIRAQDARFTLQVPVGKGIFFRSGCEEVIHDVDNVTNTLDRDMIGKTWRMTPAGLEEGRPGQLVPEPPAMQEIPAPPALPKGKPKSGPTPDEEGQKTVVSQAHVQLPSLLSLLRLRI
ncbi:MAG: PspC domain-containing protein [Flavobacteriales bacterium]|jgi:phage shock protein PspC (stress-responsive transcriptional regulator)|nr:MAG: PspC domain-containing protein [Flavobacteriales bacterium]